MLGGVLVVDHGDDLLDEADGLVQGASWLWVCLGHVRGVLMPLELSNLEARTLRDNQAIDISQAQIVESDTTCAIEVFVTLVDD